jgi:hypothetical protein
MTNSASSPQQTPSRPRVPREDRRRRETVELLRDLNKSLRWNAIRIATREQRVPHILPLIALAFLFIFSFNVTLVFGRGGLSPGAVSFFAFQFCLYLSFVTGCYVLALRNRFYRFSEGAAADQYLFLGLLELSVRFRSDLRRTQLEFLALVIITLGIAFDVSHWLDRSFGEMLLIALCWLNLTVLFVLAFLYLDTKDRELGVGEAAARERKRLGLLGLGLTVVSILFFFIPLVPYFLLFPLEDPPGFALALLTLLLLDMGAIRLWQRDIAPGTGNHWRWCRSFDMDGGYHRGFLGKQGARDPGIRETDDPGRRGWWELFYPPSSGRKVDKGPLGIRAVDQLFGVQLQRQSFLVMGVMIFLGSGLGFLLLHWWFQGPDDNYWAIICWIPFSVILIFGWPVFYLKVLEAHPAIGTRFSASSDSVHSHEFFHLMPFSARELIPRLYLFHILFFLLLMWIPLTVVGLSEGMLAYPLTHSQDFLALLFSTVVVSVTFSLLMVSFLLNRKLFFSRFESPLSFGGLLFGFIFAPMLCLILVDTMLHEMRCFGILPLLIFLILLLAQGHFTVYRSLSISTGGRP